MGKIIRFVSIGDCCADIYIKEKRVIPGGTAYNVAMSARKAGADVSIFSAIGTDAIGKRFLKKLKEEKIDTSHLAIRSGKTSSIPIRLTPQGNPIYGRWDLGVMKKFHLLPSDRRFLRTQDTVRAVLFTPIKFLFGEFCALDLGGAVKVGDFAGSSLDSIDVTGIEPYANRLDIIIKSVEDSTNKSLNILTSIARTHNCIVLALLGSQGSMVFSKDKTYYEPAKKIRTKNTTGAGDTYQAYFITTYLRTHDIQRSMVEATRAAMAFILR